jgi:hypothetical protein
MFQASFFVTALALQWASIALTAPTNNEVEPILEPRCGIFLAPESIYLLKEDAPNTFFPITDYTFQTFQKDSSTSGMFIIRMCNTAAKRSQEGSRRDANTHWFSFRLRHPAHMVVNYNGIFQQTPSFSSIMGTTNWTSNLPMRITHRFDQPGTQLFQV